MACPRPNDSTYSRRDPDDVAALGELLQGLLRHSGFDRHFATRRAALRKARRFQRFLDIHPVIDQVRNKLRVRQRLHSLHP